MENLDFLFEGSSVRIDAYLSEHMDITRSAVVKLLETNNITVNDNVVSKSYKLKSGDSIKVFVPDPVELSVEAENIPLEIIYEDNDMLVVNKPKGMVVHPAPGNYSGTLVNALMHHCKDSLSGINGVMRPGIVHRIDKDTSGLLMVAKNDFAHVSLAEQIKEHSFNREYYCVVVGSMKNKEGTIELPIGRHPIKRKQMAVTNKNSKPAKTEYKVLAEADGLSLLKVKLYTGRTHQIRVHMSYLGHAVAGDTVYGRAGAVYKNLNGQCLHAKKIGFVHPRTNKYLEFESDLPEYFKAFLKEHNFNGDF